MDIDELKDRIERFRREYLDTAAGRDHLRNQAEEPKEVSAAFEKLRADRQAGEDITEETLRRLLPHNDTKGNRERGVRISTWPCITKDVRAWFEGAHWKRPDEWPQTAHWLMDIADAGRVEDWDGWRALAHAPAQKGFACGFITPIVHCLNVALPVINSKVVKTYAEVAPNLGLGDEISPALDAYPENQARLLTLVGKLGPLGLSGLEEWDVFCHWSVSKRLGGKAVASLPAPAPLAGLNGVQQADGSNLDICEELRQAQHDTQHPDLFEAVVGRAFAELGFDTEHIGGSGEADVVARAYLGDESFSAVVDAKTSQLGVPRGNINYEPIKGHQEQHEADFAVVVAPAFSQGNTVQHAVNRSVGLLTTDRLIELVRLNRTHALSLYSLKDILGRAGLIDSSLAAWQRVREDQAEAARAILQVFEAHQRGEESSGGLTEESVFWLLKGGGGKIPKAQIGQVIQFLANPILGVLEERGDGYVLTVPARTAYRRLSSFADMLAEGNVDSAASPSIA